MPRYIRKPLKSWWEDDEPFRPSLTVDLPQPQETGLLDSDGNPLFKLPDEIGFLKQEDN